MMIFGSLGSWVFYMIIGNYAMYLELMGTIDFTGIMKTVNGSAAIVATLETLPLTGIVIGVFSAIAIIFAATTYDSASYTLASSATLNLKAGDDPAGLMPVALMYIGGLQVMQVIVLIASFPILIIGVFMSVGLVKTLKADTDPAG
jgi:BCCT family betaine/carnitine transporter